MKRLKLKWETILCIAATAAALTVFPLAGHCQDTPQLLSLAKGIKIATEENRVMKIATFNRDLASEDISIARSRFLPTINAQANYTVQAYQPVAIFGAFKAPTTDKDYPSFGVNVHQTLFDFWARESRYRSSRESLELTKTDIFRTKNVVALDFVTAYFTLLEFDRMVTVGQREVEALESHQQVAKDLYDAGAITKNDLLQAEVRLSDSRQRLLTLKNQRSFSASRINTILSRPITLEVTLIEVSEDLPPTPVLDDVWKTALLQRPEIEIVDAELKINELQETAKRSEYLPTFFADGGYNYSKNQFMVHEDNWSLILGLNINIFNGGATKSELTKIKIRSGQILEEKNKLLEDIRLEIEHYYLDERNARDNVIATKDAIRQAEENLRINKVRYEEGEGTATDVVDAIALLAMAEKNYYRALYDMQRAHAGLLYATGEDLTIAYK